MRFEFVGHPEAVTDAIERYKTGGDQSQLEMVKAFVKHELSFHTSSRSTGVLVKVNGQHTTEGRSLSIEILPVQLALDAP